MARDHVHSIFWITERSVAHCQACGRRAYRRRDGREYLYIYRLHGPAVCSPRCDAKCDCQAPEPENDGVALCSEDCPIHPGHGRSAEEAEARGRAWLAELEI